MKRFLIRCAMLVLLGTAGAQPALAQPRMTIVPAGEPLDSRFTLPYDALPDTTIGRGSKDILSAWFAEPTSRYSGGALGHDAEAGALRVFTRAGTVLTYRLADGSVFEDLKPRVHDIDGDGREEVLVVHSRPDSGSSLMALGLRDGALVPVGETPAPGNPQRWLNPVGVADVDGDGRQEVLVVLDPDTQGTLVIYHYAGGSFTESGRIGGVSNHVPGSRALGLAALVDVNGDGTVEVVLPSQDRRALRAFNLHLGRPFEQSRINLPSPAAGDFELLPDNRLIVPLEDGRRVSIRWH